VWHFVGPVGATFNGAPIGQPVTILEDRGCIGVGGRRLWRVRYHEEPELTCEVPDVELWHPPAPPALKWRRLPGTENVWRTVLTRSRSHGIEIRVIQTTHEGTPACRWIAQLVGVGTYRAQVLRAPWPEGRDQACADAIVYAREQLDRITHACAQARARLGGGS